MAKTYQRPTNLDLSNVVSLLPDHNQGEINPQTPVICVNRGPRTLTDQYDGNPVTIPPFATFEATYGMALHLQRRQIVPGTRNADFTDPSVPQYASWIGIHGIDPVDACEPFGDAFLAKVNESVEGLFRGSMTPEDRDVTVKSTRELQKSLGGLGLTPSGGGGNSLMPQQRIEGGSEESRAAVLDKVEGSDASQAVASGIAAGWMPPPDEGHLKVRSAEPPKEARPKGGRR